jgi:hypothetical protein
MKPDMALSSESNIVLGWRDEAPTWLTRLLDALMIILCGVLLGAAYFISPFAAIVLCLGLVLLTVMYRQPIVMCFILVISTVLFSGMKRGAILPWMIPNEPILGLFFILAIPYMLSRRRMFWQTPKVLWFVQIIMIAGSVLLPLVAFYYRNVVLDTAGYLKIFAPVQYILLFWLFRMIPKNERERQGLIDLLLIGAGVVAFIGLLQAFSVGPVVDLMARFYPSNQEAEATQAMRVTSLLSVWNGLGTYLTVCLLMARAQMNLLQSKARLILLYVIAFLCTCCLLASGSYAGLIGLVVGLGIIEFYDRKENPATRRMSLILLGGLLAAAIPLSSLIFYRANYQFAGGGVIPSSLAFRFKIWDQIYIPLISKYWLWGYSLNLSTLGWQWAESQYIFAILRGGIFSLLASILWVVLALVWLFFSRHRMNGTSKSMNAALFAVLIVLTLMGFTNTVFTYSGAADYLWIMLGLVTGDMGEENKK